MFTVTNAWNQRGWDFNDHLMGDRISEMVGRTYKDLSSLKRTAKLLSESFPCVEYHDGHRLYLYDGSPHLPGRQVQTIKDLGPR
jgi:hypothetical protein